MFYVFGTCYVLVAMLMQKMSQQHFTWIYTDMILLFPGIAEYCRGKFKFSIGQKLRIKVSNIFPPNANIWIEVVKWHSIDINWKRFFHLGTCGAPWGTEI